LTDGDRRRADAYEALELVIGGRKLRFPAVWLRDNCPCGQCVDPGSGLPHTDNPYRDPVPTVQLLHCLSTADDGGTPAWSTASPPPPLFAPGTRKPLTCSREPPSRSDISIKRQSYGPVSR
jgi:Gamma-butyrobetaine hydroxylase-like, N-terminal/Taurine catabolism dioxygenase TauD, TfdA family